ncbi:MAG: hypothetical protein QHH14_03070 [Clostridiales bacterium]|nr:hypothetical protein [Clostridiales bacterium]
MNYVGRDHHRQYSHITWLDERSEVVKSGRVETARRLLTIIYRILKENRPYIRYKR